MGSAVLNSTAPIDMAPKGAAPVGTFPKPLDKRSEPFNNGMKTFA